MNAKQLTADLLGIARAAAPLIGLGDELAAGEALVKAITDTVDNVKHTLDNDDQAALSIELDALCAKVNSHAERTIGSLGAP